MGIQHIHWESTYKLHSERLPLHQKWQNEYNRSMSSVRVSVEWIFGDIINYFKFMDFKNNLKIGLSQVGKMYIVCNFTKHTYMFVR
jgi:hypothetical protein